jgi:hypothetical protein
MIEGNLQHYVGKEYVIRHLTSERGQALINRKCVVTGHDGQRLLVRLKDDGSTMLLKTQNLLPAKEAFEGYVEGPLVSDQKTLEELARAVAHESIASCSEKRKDVRGRIDYVTVRLTSLTYSQILGGPEHVYFVGCRLRCRPFLPLQIAWIK